MSDVREEWQEGPEVVESRRPLEQRREAEEWRGRLVHEGVEDDGFRRMERGGEERRGPPLLHGGGRVQATGSSAPTDGGVEEEKEAMGTNEVVGVTRLGSSSSFLEREEGGQRKAARVAKEVVVVSAITGGDGMG